MLGEISALLEQRPSSNAASVWWTGVGFRNTSVDPHQIITRRAAPVSFWNL